VHLGTGHTLVIDGQGAGPPAPYVQSVRLDGVAVTSPWLLYQRLADGGELAFTLASAPNIAWGR
jgi:putative alpha-1,2-mannosidase